MNCTVYITLYLLIYLLSWFFYQVVSVYFLIYLFVIFTTKKIRKLCN